jgi:uncharacterized RDD family membrane protein YckC
MPYTAPTTGTGYAKADLGKRFVALLIDSVLAGVVYSLLGMGGIRGAGLGMLIGGAYILVRDGLALDFMDGRSIGKKVMKLRPVRLDGGAMDIEASVRRNWPLALSNVLGGAIYLIFGWAGVFATPIIALAGLFGLVEAILVLTDKDGRRFGDKFGNTQVIDAGA